MSGKPSRSDLKQAFFVRLAVWGFVLIPISVVVAAAAGNAIGAFAAIPPLVLVAVVMAVVLRTTGRGLIPGLVVAVLALLAYVVLESLSGLLSLGHPDSFADFVPALLRAVGSIMACVGLVVALRQRRSDTLRRARPMERRLMTAGMAALVVVTALSGALTYTARSDADAPRGALVVDTEDDTFEPSELRAEAREPLRIFVRNSDSYAHTFTIERLELDQYIGPRADRLITLEAPVAGSYELVCFVTGHEDMTGTLIVG